MAGCDMLVLSWVTMLQRFGRAAGMISAIWGLAGSIEVVVMAVVGVWWCCFSALFLFFDAGRRLEFLWVAVVLARCGGEGWFPAVMGQVVSPGVLVFDGEFFGWRKDRSVGLGLGFGFLVVAVWMGYQKRGGRAVVRGNNRGLFPGFRHRRWQRSAYLQVAAVGGAGLGGGWVRVAVADLGFGWFGLG